MYTFSAPVITTQPESGDLCANIYEFGGGGRGLPEPAG